MVLGWFGTVDMADPSPAAVQVVRGLERLLDDTRPKLLQPQRSWIKTNGRGWPPPELQPPPEVPTGVMPGWVDCALGVRIGHATDVDADITVGIAARHAIVGRFGGRGHFSPFPGDMADTWIDLVVQEVSLGLYTEYVWEREYRGAKCVRSQVGYVEVLPDGTRSRHMVRGFHTRTAWLRVPKVTRMERRVVTYGLAGQPG